MQPLKPVSAAARLLLGVGFFVVFIGLWGVVTYGGVVPPLFLASPGQALLAGVALFTEYGFIHDIGMTVWRVLGGFLLAAAVAVPLGLAMGAYKGVEGPVAITNPTLLLDVQVKPGGNFSTPVRLSTPPTSAAAAAMAFSAH